MPPRKNACALPKMIWSQWTGITRTTVRTTGRLSASDEEAVAAEAGELLRFAASGAGHQEVKFAFIDD